MPAIPGVHIMAVTDDRHRRTTEEGVQWLADNDMQSHVFSVGTVPNNCAVMFLQQSMAGGKLPAMWRIGGCGLIAI